MACYQHLLKLATTLCMLSSAWQFHRFSNTTFSYLFMERAWAESSVNSVVLVMIVLLCLSSITLWLPYKYTVWISLSGALVLLLEALAQTFYPPEASAIYNLPCHALRYLLPVGLILLHYKHKKQGLKLLAIATGLTFFGHGMKAFLEEIIFLDYILAFCSDIGKPIELATAVMLLHVVGTIDIALAHHITFFKWKRLRWILRYTALWGLITALARITYGGWSAWHEVILRAPHFLVPLALLLYVSRKKLKSE